MANFFFLLCYIFLNIAIIQITETTSITIAFFFPVALLLIYKKINISATHLFLFFLAAAYPLLVILFDGDNYSFLTTYILYLYFVTSIFIIFSIRYESRALHILTALTLSSYILLILLFIQFLEFNLLSSSVSIKIFKPFLLYSNDYFTNLLDYGFFRGSASFFEPSFCALVLTSLWISLNQLKHTTIKFDSFFAFGFLLTKSLSGIIVFFILIAIKYFFDKKRENNKKPNFILITVFLSTLFFLLSSLISTRLLNPTIDNSTYYRLFAPLIVIKEILLYHPLGLPLGSLYDFVSTFNLENGSVFGKSIDNGYYYIIIHFSWIGLLTLFYFIINNLKCFFTNNTQHECKYVYTFFLLAPFFTGAIFSPEFLFLVLTPYVLMKSQGFQN